MSSRPGSGGSGRGAECSGACSFVVLHVEVVQRLHPEVDAGLHVAHRAVGPEQLGSVAAASSARGRGNRAGAAWPRRPRADTATRTTRLVARWRSSPIRRAVRSAVPDALAAALRPRQRPSWRARRPGQRRCGRRTSSLPRSCRISVAPFGGVIAVDGPAGQRDQRPGQSAVQRPRRERGHARRLDAAVERLVVEREPLVVRSVARPVDVEQRHDQAGLRRVAADAAGRLDVLGASSSAGRARPSARAG